MRVVVIGATGHVGGYLVPNLVDSGHDVVAVSRGARPHYRQHLSWESVTRVSIDREAADAAGLFADTIADLGADVVVDMICFDPSSAKQLVEGLRGRVDRLIMCSTIWVKGLLTEVPADEDAISEPWGEYGLNKAAIEDILRRESLRSDGVRSTIIRPGHICGPGWAAINPQGNSDLEVWETLAAGEPLVLPNSGLETLHHVHAGDVAQAIQRAIERLVAPPFDVFNAVSPQATTLRGLASAIAVRFGQTATFDFVPLDSFHERVSKQSALKTVEHVSRSHSMSIERARRVLGYQPQYSSVEAVSRSVGWLCQSDQLSERTRARWTG